MSWNPVVRRWFAVDADDGDEIGIGCVARQVDEGDGVERTVDELLGGQVRGMIIIRFSKSASTRPIPATAQESAVGVR